MALNASNRLTRCLDRIGYFEEKLRSESLSSDELECSYLEQMNLSQKQARQFLRSLKSTYLSIGFFVLACFCALFGGAAFHLGSYECVKITAGISLFSGAMGVLGLSHASLELLLASRITIQILNVNIKSIDGFKNTKALP